MIYRVDSDGPTCWVIAETPQEATSAVFDDESVGFDADVWTRLDAHVLSDAEMDGDVIRDDMDGCSRTIREYIDKHHPAPGVFACSEWA